MATGVYDRYPLFEAPSSKWDAPFTGQQSTFHSYSSEEREIQHQNQTKSLAHSGGDDEEETSRSLSPSSSRRVPNPSNSPEIKKRKKRRSRERHLKKVKNERTLSQTNNLLQQMMDLEESLKSKPSKNCLVRKNNVDSDEAQGSTSIHAMKSSPCHKQLDGPIITPYRIEGEFSKQSFQRQLDPVGGGNHSGDRNTLGKWKESVQERAKRNAIALLRQKSPVTTKPELVQRTNNSSLPRQLSSVPVVQRTGPRISTEDHQAIRSSLESYILPSIMKALQTVPMESAKKASLLKAKPAFSVKEEQINKANEEQTTRQIRGKGEQESCALRADCGQQRSPLMDCLVQSRSSIQSVKKLREEAEKRIAHRSTIIRRSIAPSRAHRQKLSEQGFQTIREARQKRMQLMQQRQQYAQEVYLAEQRKRIIKLSL